MAPAEIPHDPITFDNINLDVTQSSPTGVTTRRILSDISTTLTEHRVAIIGANGSGKSSLVRLINGLNSPTTGHVRVGELDVARQAKRIRQRVGFIFSDADNQILMPTVVEDVAFSLRRHKLPRAQRHQRALAQLDAMGIAHLANNSPHTLSGGEKQLLALASVLILNPDIIIADEPTTLLDLHNRRRVASELAALSQQVIVVTHDLDLIRDFDRVLWIDNGRIAGDSTRSGSGGARGVVQQYEEAYGGV
ncbi:energy-coupling factor ABC transporter ATP-binding protein [Corynebacterium auriscanis]|uniref:energy-coupling factor ABC transporter ATP-binding protein n=1 Tax=Corynebacterium auriscanis TaxID=99807 RepID=UPI0024AE01A8|nr:ABC transporter ATP-binding protein [Corynebacterium auriscanis]